ncbi:MAG: methionine adenosyltransferase [Thermoguttaceae bacterium]|nr:methionine adenosyltransferase [Thermoguttaceae bacterium]
MAKRLFTSEAVSAGHPDKLADQISDSILDACLEQDPASRVACETLVGKDLAVVAGEITTTAQVEYEQIVRDVIRRVGYVDDSWGIDANTCKVMVAIHGQSPDIAQGVDHARDVTQGDEKQLGAGDQGLMFGYACNQTKELMPLPIVLAHRIVNRLTEARLNREVDWLRPDSKSQVTVEYEYNDEGKKPVIKPVRIDTVVVSTQHSEKVGQNQIREWLVPNVIQPILSQLPIDKEGVKFKINETGTFVIGGPCGDCGLTGRKIIVDTYGGWARHGGGAFSGKDPTKVDRSAAYMARHIAKNIVAAELADSCEIQLAYVIGLCEPVSVRVDTEGTGKIGDDVLADLIREHFRLTPQKIIEHLNLCRPIFKKTATGGHFGRDDEDFTWELTEHIEDLKQAAKKSL